MLIHFELLVFKSAWRVVGIIDFNAASQHQLGVHHVFVYPLQMDVVHGPLEGGLR